MAPARGRDRTRLIGRLALFPRLTAAWANFARPLRPGEQKKNIISPHCLASIALARPGASNAILFCSKNGPTGGEDLRNARIFQGFTIHSH